MFRKSWALWFGSLLLVLGCGPSNRSAPEPRVTGQREPTRRPEDSIAVFSPAMAKVRTLAAGDSEPVVTRVLGKPDSMAAYEDSLMGETEQRHYRDARAILAQRRLVYFYCWGSQCQTPVGIGVGSTSDQVLRRMGRAEAVVDSGKHELRYALPERDCALVFVLNDAGVVSRADLRCPRRRR